jgi:hypothetical protein
VKNDGSSAAACSIATVESVNPSTEVADIPAWLERVEEEGLPAADDRGRLRFRLAPKDRKSHDAVIREVIRVAVEIYES